MFLHTESLKAILLSQVDASTYKSEPQKGTPAPQSWRQRKRSTYNRGPL